jgi:hypothetical protein
MRVLNQSPGKAFKGKSLLGLILNNEIKGQGSPGKAFKLFVDLIEHSRTSEKLMRGHSSIVFTLKF